MAKVKQRSSFGQGIQTGTKKGATVVTYTRKKSLPKSMTIVKKGNTTVVTIRKKKAKKCKR